MRRIIILLLLFIFLPSKVYSSSAVIINQLRGSESCCQMGTNDLVNAINSSDDINTLPMGWALRYDLLDNEEVIRSLKKPNYEIGGLLEITPLLAHDSKVEYKGDNLGSDWHNAKNVFLVGYSQDDRKKLIDTYFNKFRKVVGKHPKFTVSWMIDSWSLEYISNKYGVVFHEITKEQYETDSYTLYGGIFNAPYYPSKNHPLIPSKNSNSLIIVRQTISDPIYNYGFSKAFYTSQPNDYLSNNIEKKDISYFKNLVDNIVSQKSGYPLAVVGFENSFDFNKYGFEYLNQLKYLASQFSKKKIEVRSPQNTYLDFIKKNKFNTPFTIEQDFYSDSNLGVLWYFSSYYRVRILKKDNNLIITDFRNYNQIPDPYYNSPLLTDYGYYVVPYLFDSSQQNSIRQQYKEMLETNDIGTNVVSDVYSDPYGIVLGNGSFTKEFNNGVLALNFKNKEGFIYFKEKEIVIDKSIDPSLNMSTNYYFSELIKINKNNEIIIDDIDKHFNFVISNNSGITLGYENDNTEIPLFKLNENQNSYSLTPLNYGNEITALDSIYRPDKTDLNIDFTKSTFYWNNVSAVVNRNPIRLYVAPLNNIGRPAKIKTLQISFSSNEGISIDYPPDYNTILSPWFVDISSSKPQVTKITINIDGQDVVKEKKLYFLPNCRQNLISCLTSLQEVIQYASYRLSEIPARLSAAPKIYEKDNRSDNRGIKE